MYAAMYTSVRYAGDTAMETKVLRISDTVDEVQVLDDNGNILQAGTWTKPYDLDVAVQSILQVAMGRYAMA
jgi:hypothetical protein